MLVTIQLNESTKIEAGNQQKRLSLSFATKA